MLRGGTEPWFCSSTARRAQEVEVCIAQPGVVMNSRRSRAALASVFWATDLFTREMPNVRTTGACSGVTGPACTELWRRRSWMPIWSGCTGSAGSVVGSCLFSFSHIYSLFCPRVEATHRFMQDIERRRLLAALLACNGLQRRAHLGGLFILPFVDVFSCCHQEWCKCDRK